MKVITPPHPIPIDQPIVFLAGSIDNGKAEPWQDWLIQQLKSYNLKGTILNPRRPDWDSSWVQDKANPVFYEQVSWELQGLEMAKLIVVYFAPNSTSPITLLELGLFGRQKSMVVCCPDGFWRKGNVDIVCERYGIPQVNSLEGLVQKIATVLS